MHIYACPYTHAQVAVSERTARRLVVKLGYRCVYAPMLHGACTGRSCQGKHRIKLFKLSMAVARRRARYLWWFQHLTCRRPPADEPVYVIYLDESYVHEHKLGCKKVCPLIHMYISLPSRAYVCAAPLNTG